MPNVDEYAGAVQARAFAEKMSFSRGHTQNYVWGEFHGLQVPADSQIPGRWNIYTPSLWGIDLLNAQTSFRMGYTSIDSNGNVTPPWDDFSIRTFRATGTGVDAGKVTEWTFQTYHNGHGIGPADFPGTVVRWALPKVGGIVFKKQGNITREASLELVTTNPHPTYTLWGRFEDETASTFAGEADDEEANYTEERTASLRFDSRIHAGMYCSAGGFEFVVTEVAEVGRQKFMRVKLERTVRVPLPVG